MILDCGAGKADFECECGRVHYKVSVGEETTICVCGAVLTFKEKETFYEYFWMSPRMCRVRWEQAINSDKRNLC